MLYKTIYHSPIGALTLGADETHLVGLWLAGQKYFGAGYQEPFAERADHPVLQKAVQWLQSYFAGERPLLSALPLNPQGSPFRKRVWQILCEIPYGQVVTYGDIARRLAQEQGQKVCLPRLLAVRWGITPFPLLFRAIAWWGRTGV